MARPKIYAVWTRKACPGSVFVSMVQFEIKAELAYQYSLPHVRPADHRQKFLIGGVVSVGNVPCHLPNDLFKVGPTVFVSWVPYLNTVSEAR